MHEQTNRLMRSFGGGLEGEIAVGISSTLARSSLAPALARFIALHPNVVIRILEGFNDLLTEKVRTGELEFAIVAGSGNTAGIRSTLFATTPELFVWGTRSGRDVPLEFSLAKLGPIKIVLPSAVVMRRRSIDNYLVAAQANVERRLEIDTMSAKFPFIAMTDWVSILPSLVMSAERGRGELGTRLLIDPPLSLDLFLIQQAQGTLSMLAMLFLDLLREETEHLNRAEQVAHQE